MTERHRKSFDHANYLHHFCDVYDVDGKSNKQLDEQDGRLQSILAAFDNRDEEPGSNEANGSNPDGVATRFVLVCRTGGSDKLHSYLFAEPFHLISSKLLHWEDRHIGGRLNQRRRLLGCHFDCWPNRDANER
jgi:hypothetical protein